MSTVKVVTNAANVEEGMKVVFAVSRAGAVRHAVDRCQGGTACHALLPLLFWLLLALLPLLMWLPCLLPPAAGLAAAQWQLLALRCAEL